MSVDWRRVGVATVLLWVGAWGCARVGAQAPSSPAVRPSAAMTGTVEPPAPGPSDTTSGCPDTKGQRVFELVNQARAEAGLGPLKVDLRLVTAARDHARDMAEKGLTGHEGSDGSQPPERVIRAGYHFSAVGENVAAGVRTAEEVMADWMGSEHHRENILGAYDDIGVAFLDVPWSEYGTYWVQVFGSPRSSEDEGAWAGCNP